MTSHRRVSCGPATARWLEKTGIPCDDLHCSFDKIARCVELEIDVLVDDSPVNIVRAKEAGITPATLIHPWNERTVSEHAVIAARDWAELEARLAPILAG